MAGTGRGGGRAVAPWRTVLGVLLAVLAGLAAALTPVAGWGYTLLDVTDTFVATYSPVLQSEPVRQALTTRLTDAIVEEVGIDTDLVRELVTEVVEGAVTSDAFAEATTTGLRLAHAELVAQLSGTGQLEVSDGVVRLPFAPFGEALKQRLGDAGVPFVDRLPTLSGGITLFTVDPELLPSLRTAFGILNLTAPWLGWLAIVLAVAAVWIGPGLRRPLLWLGLGLLGWVLLIGLAWYLAMHWLIQHLGDDLGPVAGLVADVTSAAVTTPLIVLGAGGALLAVLAGLSIRLRKPATDPAP